MDTEGFGASDATVDSDAKLFSLATLLCSLLIYNRCPHPCRRVHVRFSRVMLGVCSVGAIDEEAITSLAFIADLTKHIHTKMSQGDSEAAAATGARSSDDDGAAFHSFFPSFLWVLRDFVLDIVDEVSSARTHHAVAHRLTCRCVRACVDTGWLTAVIPRLFRELFEGAGCVVCLRVVYCSLNITAACWCTRCSHAWLQH